MWTSPSPFCLGSTYVLLLHLNCCWPTRSSYSLARIWSLDQDRRQWYYGGHKRWWTSQCSIKRGDGWTWPSYLPDAMSHHKAPDRPSKKEWWRNHEPITTRWWWLLGEYSPYDALLDVDPVKISDRWHFDMSLQCYIVVEVQVERIWKVLQVGEQ